MASSIRVLHVDDVVDFADTAGTFLERADERIEVLTESTAAEGLEHIESADVDCVVSDYQMPGMDGLEFLEAVRKNHPELPFLLVTGQGSEEVASEALTAGATDYLQKGSGVEQFQLLANRVLNVVEQYRSRKRAADLDRVRTLASDVNQALVRAESREEIERRVCELISRADPYRFAWIASYTEGAEDLAPRTTAGGSEGSLVELFSSERDSREAIKPVQAALLERRTVVHQDIASGDQTETWEAEALDRGYRSMAAVPLVHDETLYGVLGVYADRVASFDGSERSMLGDLADNIAHAIYAVELRDTLRSERDRRTALFKNAPGPVLAGEVVAMGDDHEITAVNDAFTEVFGYDREEVLGRDIAEFLVPPEEMERHKTFRKRAEIGESTVAEVERITKEGPRDFLLHIIPFGTGEMGTNGWYAWYTDITDRLRQENRIAGLNEMLAEFMEAESLQHLGSILVETAERELDVPVAELVLLDESTGELQPAARSALAEAHLQESALFDGSEGPAWDAFVSDTQITVEDPSPELIEDSVGIESLHIHGLGRHGVLITGTRSSDRDFLETVTGNLQTAIDRLDRESRLKDREARLEDQNEWLDRLNRINDVIRSIDQALVRATTRVEIEQAVCAEMVDVEGYSFTWIGEYDPTTDRILQTQWAGREAGYLDTTFDATEDHIASEPTRRAARTHEPQVVENIVSEPPYPAWREAALKRGYRSCIALPLLYRDSLYGVLTIYADEPNRFDELEREVLLELSETIAYAMNALESKRALVSDEIHELELDVTASDVPLVRFIQEHPSRDFELKGIVPGKEAAYTVFYVSRGSPAEEVIEFTEQSPALASTELITKQDDQCLFECTVPEDSLLFWLLDRGAVPRGISATDDGARLRIELAGEADIRDFVELFEAEYPNTELVASRTRERPVRAREEFHSSYVEALTDRQREVLRTAFLSGYFESPRDRTGQEIASALGISQPTFSENLRTALRKLLALVYEETDAPR